MTLPFFTNKVVHQYSDMWENEMDLVVDDLKNNENVKYEGIVIRKRLQLMLYNIMYRMMLDDKFESQDDPLFIEATKFNSESRLAQSFDYNYETKVVVNAWWLANNPAWWKNPNEFRPERFLEEDGGTEAVVAGGKVDFRYLPFGMGRWSCPGIILALPILELVIAKLISNFEMQAHPGEGKIDTSEKRGQFSLHIAKHSTVVFKPVAA
ncbi:hypothetical protein K7X08_026414 [Anisodus acutangulus]|uniref:Cytochrome P450 n=1 Tax=Anisodus acutangulus TaxID=402998 RepID=A0A9Q1R603_9SOLA|nr:hypothetical protein K7X08_026414 [Anisodus acutangulus]